MSQACDCEEEDVRKTTLMLLIFVGLIGCSTSPQLTKAERFEHEMDRREKYIMWHQSCMSLHLTVLTVSTNMRPRCPRKGICIPKSWQWDFYYLPVDLHRAMGRVDWRERAGNTVMCGRWIL